MRGAFSAVEMTLVLNVVGCVSPTESAPDGSLLQCEGLNNQSYSCKSGHCCGEANCCSYYYELWWFWLVWAIIFILCCCCICHHRRTKHRLQQQQRQHEINLIAYREAHNYTAVPFYFRFLPNYLLPDYEEVVNRPLTPPPPYSALHTVSSTLPSGPLSGPQQEGRGPAVQSAPASLDPDPLRPRAALEGADPAGVGFFLPGLDAKSPHAAQHSGGTISRSGTALDRGLALVGEGLAASDKREGPLMDLGGAPPPGSCAEEKRLLPAVAGRRRRFTGDSGIEVCVCRRRGSGGAGLGGGRELKELESLLGCTEDANEEEDEEEEEEEGGGGREFCESCGPRAHLSEDEEPDQEAPRRGADPETPAPQTSSSSSSSSSSSGSCDAPAMCALVHTVNELEVHHHGNVPEGRAL